MSLSSSSEKPFNIFGGSYYDDDDVVVDVEKVDSVGAFKEFIRIDKAMFDEERVKIKADMFDDESDADGDGLAGDPTFGADGVEIVGNGSNFKGKANRKKKAKLSKVSDAFLRETVIELRESVRTLVRRKAIALVREYLC